MSKKKKSTPLDLFFGRLIREGRKAEYDALLKERTEKLPFLSGLAKAHATRKLRGELALEMGYQGVGEKALHRLYLNSAEVQIDAIVQRRVAAVAKAQKPALEWEEAVASLPPSADMRVEFDWISAHPAMSRHSRQTDMSKPVLLTSNDILHAKHGPAPSAAAANRLQNWAASPAKWNDYSAALMKKPEATESSPNSDVMEDVGLEEIERLLKEVAGA